MSAFTGLMLLLATFTVSETYNPVLLRRLTADISKRTGLVYVSSYDVGREKHVLPLLCLNLLGPLKLLLLESIVLFLSPYMSIIYGLLYLFFIAFPIVFVKHRHWSIAASGLAFTGIGVGSDIDVLMTPTTTCFYRKTIAKAEDGKPPPEARLLMGCVGEIFLPVSSFWFAWTCQADFQYMASMVATVVFGIGLVFTFWPSSTI